jgi:chaperonin cofactor prefoldin
MGNLGQGNEDQDKLISMLARHAESINGKMTDLLKRSEKLSENAKRLSGQIDTMLRE